MALAGHQVLVSCATGASATYAVMDGIKQFSLNDSRDLLDITDFRDAIVRARIVGLRDYQVSLSGEIEPGDTGYAHAKACYDAGTPLTLALLHNTTTTAGFGYQVMLESFEVSASVDGTVELSISGSASSGTTPWTI
jgi:predicted secreted protein